MGIPPGQSDGGAASPAALGPYEVLAGLGRGGMASLLLARRSGPGDFSRHVAIKVVHEEHAHDAELVSMLLDEARLSAHVQHPNVVRVEELGEVEGRPYLVMEHVDGVNLSALLAGLASREELLAIDVAAHVAAQVAAGLHAAHESTDERGRPLGMVHRDVSPQNVMLGATGQVKVIDFGVAKAKGRLTSTQRGALKGKLAYMAPEQLDVGGAVDRRTDVFAIGVLLWEMLTLRRLFYSKSSADVMRRIREGRVIAPRSFRPELSEALEAVVMRALAPSPGDRFATAEELRRAIVDASATGVEPSQIAALVRRAARDEVERTREPIPTALLESTVVSSEATGTPMTKEALVRRAERSIELGDDDGVISSIRGLLGWRAIDHVEALAARTGAATALLARHHGDLAAERTAWQALLDAAEEREDERGIARATIELGRTLLALGAYEKAERELTRVMEIGPGGGGDELAVAHVLRGRARTMQDRFDDAEADFGAASRLALARGDGRTALEVALHRADAAFRSGRRCLARAEAERVLAIAQVTYEPDVQLRACVEVARAALATRDVEGAVAAARQAAAIARGAGLSLEAPNVALVLALIAEVEGRAGDAAALRERARAALRERAARVSDPIWRERFETWIPDHAELLTEG